MEATREWLGGPAQAAAGTTTGVTCASPRTADHGSSRLGIKVRVECASNSGCVKRQMSGVADAGALLGRPGLRAPTPSARGRARTQRTRRRCPGATSASTASESAFAPGRALAQPEGEGDARGPRDPVLSRDVPSPPALSYLCPVPFSPVLSCPALSCHALLQPVRVSSNALAQHPQLPPIRHALPLAPELSGPRLASSRNSCSPHSRLIFAQCGQFAAI